MNMWPQIDFSSTRILGQAQGAVQYLLGVDGGGTGTRVRLADLKGVLLGQGEAGPSALGQGAEQAWRHIQEAAQAAAAQAGLPTLNPAQCAIGLGLSGAGVVEQVEAFLALQPGYALLALDNDGFTTLLGAHGGQPGLVVAAGTGSVGEGLRRDGSRAYSSGWGWICGDEGSGAWLGLRAMRHAQKALDGRAEVSPLARAVWGVAGSDRTQILAWCASAGQHGYASLARLVFDAAPTDPVAAGFVAEAVTELESLALALDPTSELPLALCGSIAQRMAADFSGTIRARCVSPQGDSAEGALHLVRIALQRREI
ncbi:BadF/BadG/BcrA/BcrD ATPase family protein [Paucibacter sp. Y2R2-4]|uniref:BadF/BadG/BcrA/BcrD ATPase family protein n=1 Tax=Paucibacter sp. Y2R2-4 TaxID=2893553 RepID=UPI0021E4FD0F|nr:BadF/BadG/BcrA/BcrD ATPase family protein [Paucibacter sp. Y2R2-4]MCV2351031.1 ATPase [Paucibacter sp. Y2R2-4]